MVERSQYCLGYFLSALAACVLEDALKTLNILGKYWEPYEMLPEGEWRNCIKATAQ